VWQIQVVPPHHRAASEPERRSADFLLSEKYGIGSCLVACEGLAHISGASEARIHSLSPAPRAHTGASNAKGRAQGAHLASLYELHGQWAGRCSGRLRQFQVGRVQVEWVRVTHGPSRPIGTYSKHKCTQPTGPTHWRPSHSVSSAQTTHLRLAQITKSLVTQPVVDSPLSFGPTD